MTVDTSLMRAAFDAERAQLRAKLTELGLSRDAIDTIVESTRRAEAVEMALMEITPTVH